MFHFIVSLFVVIIFNDVCLGDGWDPSNFTFNPGQDYELVWQDEFENVGSPQANISGKLAYMHLIQKIGLILLFVEN